MMRFKSAILASALAFYACGDDSSADASQEESSDSFSLPECNSKWEGVSVDIPENGRTYVCEDGEWYAVKVTTKESSSSAIIESSSAKAESSSSESTSSSAAATSSSATATSSSDKAVSSSETVESSSNTAESSSDTVESSSDEAESSSDTAESSSDEAESSSDTVESSSDEASSSSIAEISSSSEGCANGCGPNGEGCTYVTTEFLNNDLTYGELLDKRECKVYRTITIQNAAGTSSQTWMAQHLDYEIEDGKKSFCYNKNSEQCKKYGRLYMRSALGTDFNKLCPEGWRLPTINEYETLATNLGGKTVAGKTMKTAGIGGNNTSGFSAAGGGIYNYNSDGKFLDLNSFVYLWSSSEKNSGFLFIRLNASNAETTFSTAVSTLGMSIRCIKN